jgi:ABC-2 type transport system permease protein
VRISNVGGDPLTYEVDALRALMVSGAVSAYGVGTDVVILLISITLLVGIGAWMYPKVVI